MPNLDISKPVRAKAAVLANNFALKHYQGQQGQVRVAKSAAPDIVMVYWKELRISSFWSIRDLENVPRAK